MEPEKQWERGALCVQMDFKYVCKLLVLDLRTCMLKIELRFYDVFQITTHSLKGIIALSGIRTHKFLCSTTALFEHSWLLDDFSIIILRLQHRILIIWPILIN